MRRRILCLFACALPLLTIPPSPARADHPRPFGGAFDFTTVNVQVLSPTRFLVTGNLAGRETHLGRMVGQVTYLVNLPTGFSGSLWKQAANGDLLYQTLSGRFTATGSKGEFVVTGGTGRFRSATGGGIFEGVWTDPAGTTAQITFDGWLDY